MTAPSPFPMSAANARHYAWGEGCDGWHLHEGEDLSVIEEFFYILAGEATLEIDGQTHRLLPGQGLHVPPGAAHQLRNEHAAELRMLVISAPRSHGDRKDIDA
jgi:mannose-6-phosphate isomerase-like protein (cupin superfamily)